MRKLLAALTICLLSFSAQAEDFSTDFQLSLTPEVAIHEKDIFITGLSIGLWSENPQNFAAFGLINGSRNRNNNIYSAQESFSSGFSFGLINYTENYKGLHIGIYNSASIKFTGVQIGCINKAKAITGTQIGFINYCKYMNQGFQLGLININAKEDELQADTDTGASIMPIVNWSF